jgi:hypothetical protein
MDKYIGIGCTFLSNPNNPCIPVHRKVK